MQKKYLILLVPVLLLVACSTSTWVINSASSGRIPIDKTTEAIADNSYNSYLEPFKQQIDKEMNVVIGKASENMSAEKPESLLSNFNADVYRQSATEYLKYPADIAIVNLGGLRTQISQGDMTVRKVFELMPFENELVILWLKGDKLNDLLQDFAAIGGQGVSGLRFEIKNGKAVNITVGGIPLDTEKTYIIATNDYLAAGNDKMPQLAQSEKSEFTGIKVREMLLAYIKAETAKGNVIQSKLDGRITPNP